MKNKTILEIDHHSFDARELRDYRRPFVVSVVLNLILIATVIILAGKSPEIITRIERLVIEKPVEDMPLTDSAIVHELTQMGCVLPTVALAQMKLETGHFRSKICRENKNIAGIRTSKSKHVTGMRNGHCSYNSYRDCLRDYVRIQNRYLASIDGKYAEDPNYIQQIRNIK